MDTGYVAWVLLAVELAITVLSGIVVSFMGWYLTTMYAEFREMIQKHYALDSRVLVLETRAESSREARAGRSGG